MAASNAPKRTFRDIWPHLIVSACALLLPPLGMAAGVMYLGSSHPHETVAVSAAEPAAPIAVAAEPTRAAEPSPAVASVVPNPAEHRATPEPQVAVVPAPAPAATTSPASTKEAATKDAATKETAAKNAPAKNAAAKEAAAKEATPAPSAAPAATAKVGESSEPTARAEAAAPTETAEAPAASAANAQQSGQKSRHESRGGRVRQARIPSITDIFLHPIRTR
jgi:hypothetical protein